ncbi:MAG: hypothetical protein ACRDWG_19625, partial [Actinomycetes bacterium]
MVDASAIDRTFEAVIFDWDGTAVPDRSADARAVRGLVEALCAAGVHVVVISGTHVGNVDGQLRARPEGPGTLHLALNRGSEVFAVGPGGVEVVWRRTASSAEDRELDLAADATVVRLGERGVRAEVVSNRLNRRKIDIIPEPEWADPPKARIGELTLAVANRLHTAGWRDLAEVVAVAVDASRAAGIPDPRISSDVKHVEVGLTDKSDSARWAAGWLANRGITGELILIGGDEFGPIGGVIGSDSLMLVPELERAIAISVGVEPEGCPEGVLSLGGGPARFLELLERQLARRRGRRVPAIDRDPAWTVPLPSSPQQARAAEAMGTVANGWTGTRAAPEEGGPETQPLFVVNGVYTADSQPQLVPGPQWTRLSVPGPAEPDGWVLDLRTGVLLRQPDDDSGLRTLRFASAARPHALALRAEAAAPIAPAAISPETPEAPEQPGSQFAISESAAGGAIAMVARDWHGRTDDLAVVERIAAWSAQRAGRADAQRARARVADQAGIGFDRLLAEHRQAWAQRWADAAVVIEGAPDDQLAARFAVFHLLASAPDDGEAAVGARGLTGSAYGGHVFWDAEVFVLPVLAALRPATARAMLEYRIRRLGAARTAARSRGQTGARFPWESAGDGRDVTPARGIRPDGTVVPIRTGEHEEHIVADVAWAANHYAAWSGDAAFLAGPGRDLVLETARYWATRTRLDPAGQGHLYGVMGPDEYHEVVDDNAFTNVMVRWHLRRAAELSEPGSAEAARWRELADSMVDGYDPGTGRYEQFAGYWELEPLLITEFANPPVTADVLLGADRVAQSQIIKQADVLMLHHLVPDEVAPGSLGPNLSFYGPRTAHGSSLSPSVHTALLARAGEPDRALGLFRTAARLDLDDLGGTTAGGLHLANLGGIWQSLAFGFLGLRARGDA